MIRLDSVTLDISCLMLDGFFGMYIVWDILVCLEDAPSYNVTSEKSTYPFVGVDGELGPFKAIIYLVLRSCDKTEASIFYCFVCLARYATDYSLSLRCSF